MLPILIGAFVLQLKIFRGVLMTGEFQLDDLAPLAVDVGVDESVTDAVGLNHGTTEMREAPARGRSGGARERKKGGDKGLGS